jgi:hypothetical protein
MRFLLFVGLAASLATASATAAERLPGHELALRSAVKRSDSAIVARLDEQGTISPGPPGASDFHGTKWTVEKRLRGTGALKVTLGFTVQTFPESLKEETPAVGERYIALIGNGWVLKFVRDTPENLRYVVTLLSK